MPLSHAVLWLDHQTAQLLLFDREHVQSQRVKAHTHHTRQHGSAVRTEHEFFGEVCEALAGIEEVLVTGGHTAQADFKRYAEKHKPARAASIVGYEIVDHPDQKHLLALARKYFLERDRAAGNATPPAESAAPHATA